MALLSSFPIIKPSLLLDFANVKALDPRITFTRTTTATYYDGVTTAKAEENLLLYSQEFNESYWNKLRATATANADTAPDGTATADAVLQASGETTAGQAQRASFPVVAGDYVISIFAKPNGKNFLRILESLSDGTNNTTWFDVSTGSVETTDAGHTATITASTNSYYRCTIKFTVNAARTGTVLFGLADTDNSTVVADDTNGLYLWGAQLEQRSAVSSYTPTTTQPITNYIPVLLTAASGVARFDHNPTTGESLGLLVEEQRTNLLTYSEEFANAAYQLVRATITANTIVAPNGTLTGDKLVEDTTASNSHFIQPLNVNFTSGTTYTQSVYAKVGERTNIRMAFPSAAFTSTLNAYFDLSAGSSYSLSSGVTATITSVGNGWYRCTATAAATITATSSLPIVWLISGSGTSTTSSYTGDGYSGIYIWGAQLEAGAFPTSYIPTVASTVTRNADAASMTGTNFSSWYRADEGSLCADWIAGGSSTSDESQISISDGTTNNAFGISWIGGAFNRYGAFMFTSGTSQLTGINEPTNTSPRNTQRKVAFVYKSNDAIGCFGGTLTSADTLLNIPVVNQLVFASGAGTNRFLNGTIKKIAYYPSRLADAQLQALTAS